MTTHAEFFVATKNIPLPLSNTPLYTFSMTAVSTVFNTSFALTTDYSFSTYTIAAHNQSSQSGWDHIATNSDPAIVPKIGFGLYKFYSADHDFYIYVDYRDTRYPYNNMGSCTGQCADIWVWYDGITNNFYISSHSTQTPYSQIQKGDYLTIWGLQGKGAPSTSGFQNYWSTCLSVIPRYNSDNFLVPFIVWGPIPNFSATGYKIYRSIRPQGMPPGTYSHVATVSSEKYSYLDEEILANGSQVAYYKVKAYNGSSESDYTNTTNISVSGFYKSDISSQQRELHTISLFQNHPNPFNPSTDIIYTLRTPADVSIIVYNIVGQEVRRLVNAFQSEGKHFVTFHAAGLPSGVYYYTVLAGGVSETKKMMYIR